MLYLTHTRLDYLRTIVAFATGNMTTQSNVCHVCHRTVEYFKPFNSNRSGNVVFTCNGTNCSYRNTRSCSFHEQEHNSLWDKIKCSRHTIIQSWNAATCVMTGWAVKCECVNAMMLISGTIKASDNTVKQAAAGWPEHHDHLLPRPSLV